MRFFWFLKGPDQVPIVADDLDRLSRPRVVLWMTALVLALFLAWASWAELDEITRAPGNVIPSTRTQLVQSQDGGILEELLVQEGDTVNPGQVLARIDRTRAEAAYLETRAQVAALSAQTARLKAELFGGEPEFPAILTDYSEFMSNQRELLNVRRTAHSEEQAALGRMRDLIEEELDLNRPLIEAGDVSRTEVLRLERQLADIVAQATNKRNEYLKEVQAELGAAQEELTALNQLLTQRRYLLQQTELRAPVRGVVKNVRITTLGGVIRPGEDVMQIVPLEDNLLIEARVSPGDIAFLRVGDQAKVKIDAYDATIYGDLPGELVFISADTLEEDLRQGEEPYYRARVQTSGRRFSGRSDQDLDIQPGMTAVVEIKTGSRTVLQYLTKPITKTLDDALGER